MSVERSCFHIVYSKIRATAVLSRRNASLCSFFQTQSCEDLPEGDDGATADLVDPVDPVSNNMIDPAVDMNMMVEGGNGTRSSTDNQPVYDVIEAAEEESEERELQGEHFLYFVC